jgi:ABC-type bacteriocin/lantibiotic exporter with double-glycine peptidase domain
VGKSTFLSLLIGDLTPTEGDVDRNRFLRIGKYSQHFVDVLHMAKTPVEYLQSKFPELQVHQARALLGRRPMLVFDEPTSAMDFSTESQITRRMASFAQGRTVVLVTHRTSMLALVQRVIVVDNGRIVADGPRERVMEALAAGRIAKAGS